MPLSSTTPRSGLAVALNSHLARSAVADAATKYAELQPVTEAADAAELETVLAGHRPSVLLVSRTLPNLELPDGLASLCPETDRPRLVILIRPPLTEQQATASGVESRRITRPAHCH